TTASCRLNPQRMPKDTWSFVQNVKGTQSEDMIAKNQGWAYAYSKWFFDNFGIASYEPVAEAEGASNALVGPLPTDEKSRVPFRSIKGATIMMAQQSQLLFGTRAEYIAQNNQLVREAAERAAGGDLKTLIEASGK